MCAYASNPDTCSGADCVDMQKQGMHLAACPAAAPEKAYVRDREHMREHCNGLLAQELPPPSLRHMHVTQARPAAHPGAAPMTVGHTPGCRTAA